MIGVFTYLVDRGNGTNISMISFDTTLTRVKYFFSLVDSQAEWGTDYFGMFRNRTINWKLFYTIGSDYQLSTTLRLYLESIIHQT